MTVLTSDSSIYDSFNGAFDTWLKEQILKLSVDTLKSHTVTCTACVEVLGTYIIDYQGQQVRYSPSETYAILQFIAQQG